MLWQELTPLLPVPFVFAWLKDSRAVQESELQVPPAIHHHFIASPRSLALVAVLLSVPIDSNYTCQTAAGTEPLPFAQGFYLSLGRTIKVGSLVPVPNI